MLRGGATSTNNKEIIYNHASPELARVAGLESLGGPVGTWGAYRRPGEAAAAHECAREARVVDAALGLSASTLRFLVIAAFNDW